MSVEKNSHDPDEVPCTAPPWDGVTPWLPPVVPVVVGSVDPVEVLGADVVAGACGAEVMVGVCGADVGAGAFAVSWWKNAAPSAAVEANAIVPMAPSRAPAARMPRVRTFIPAPLVES
jgi:hypothetical protein